MAAYLQLVSTRNDTQLQGWNAGDGWEGWVPIHSFFFGKNPPNVGGSGSDRQRLLDAQEITLTAKMTDVDTSTLTRWSVEGEPTSAKLDLLPSGGGGGGQQVVLTGVFVASVQIGGDMVSFTLNFEKIEFRYLLMR